jgi:hypothetical protein
MQNQGMWEDSNSKLNSTQGTSNRQPDISIETYLTMGIITEV